MSQSTSGSPLRRLHAALVQALRERDPGGLGRPFTVAEIYQDLVPYRTHRDAIGVEMNGDYEHLVLRLLAGEEGLVAVESQLARQEMEAELGRSNPNTGIFRDYAAVDVRLVETAPEATDTDEEEAVVILPAPDDEAAPSSVDDFAPEDDLAAADETARDEAPLPGDDGTCHWCRATLPVRETLNFCPYCGTDIAVVPCRSCGEAIEPGWRFCIQCGTAADEG